MKLLLTDFLINSTDGLLVIVYKLKEHKKILHMEGTLMC